MTIYINHPNDPNERVEAPEVRISGKEVDTTDGTLDSITRIYSRNSQRIIGNETQTTARDIDHRAVDAFRRSVKVTINQDTSGRRGFDNNQPTWRKAVESRVVEDNNIFVGEPSGGLTQNETMYTYYTLNGKDPKRTKAYLYTGPFTVRQNKSGGDNFILKARTYINGISSPIRTVEFRIVDDKENSDLVNKLTLEAQAT